MKNLKRISVLLCLTFSGIVMSQLSIGLNFNSAPSSNSDNYYYLPDVEAYYDIHESRYIYFDGREWIHSTRLPGRYRNYDMDRGQKVIIANYRGRTPYINFNNHRKMYPNGYRGNTFRESEKHENHERSNNHRNYENNENKGNHENHGHPGEHDKNDRR